VLLLFAGVILFRNVYWLLVWYAVVLLLIVVARLPLAKILPLSFYPIVFALVFAFSSYNGNWAFFFAVLLKVVVAASTMLLLVSTTPYPRIFGSLGRVVPSAITAALFLIYRSVFILLDTLESLQTTMRLRGGFSWRRPVRTLSSLTRNLGYLLIKAVDTSERMYEIMELRGFDGKIRYRPPETQAQLSTNLAVVAFELGLLLLLVLALR
jgi:cobalt/nickel transport system permease protein